MRYTIVVTKNKNNSKTLLRAHSGDGMSYVDIKPAKLTVPKKARK